MLKNFLIILLLFSHIAMAAKIQGVIYDNSLNKVNNVIVEISPLKQRYVAKYGAYNFEMPIGTYTITATKKDLISKEEIIIDKEGTYNLDLVLFPSFEDEEELLNETEIIIEPIKENNNYEIYSILVILTIFIIWKRKSFLKQYRKVKKLFKKQSVETKKEEITSDLESIIKFIKNRENRTTQKEIRQNFNLSEAKISLMISELESLGKIKKIKKGRGNIIILNDTENSQNS